MLSGSQRCTYLSAASRAGDVAGHPELTPTISSSLPVLLAGTGLTQLLLYLISSGAELLNCPARPPGKLGQLLRAEQEQHDKEDYHHVRPGKIQDTGDHCIHGDVSVKRHVSFTHSYQFGRVIFRKSDL